jgi:hypothetical protein
VTYKVGTRVRTFKVGTKLLLFFKVATKYVYFLYNLTICGPWGKVCTKFILLARKVPTLVATFPHKTSITMGSARQLFPLPPYSTYTERGSGAVSDDKKLSVAFCY